MWRVLRCRLLISRSFCVKADNCVKLEARKNPGTRVREGKAEIILTQDAFYNPVQEFNRDLSVAVIKEFIKTYVPKDINCLNNEVADGGSKGRIHILEALAASGLRSIRYAKEIPGVGTVTANDRSETAVEDIKQNIKLNEVDHIVLPNCEDAVLLMNKHRSFQNQFHVVDLDPYGSPSSFLDAAVQCISDKGLLLVTCTDTANLCGRFRGKCHASYGSLSLRMSSCHEMALRIILRSIELHANRYGRHIMPLVSVHADFYIRVFVKVCESPNNANKSIEKLAMVYSCTGCGTFHLQHLSETMDEEGISVLPQPPPALCEHCGCKFQLAGPIWTDNLHDKDFVSGLLKTVESERDNYGTTKRMIGILSVISEELDNCPLYYRLPHLLSVVASSQPSLFTFRSALLNAGYQASLSHTCRDSLKTNAPSEVIWDIVRSWAKLNPVKRDITGTPGEAILKKNINTPINFDPHPEAEPLSRSLKLVRFQQNPKPHWGPKTKIKQRKKDKS
ncbi:tRNA (guanine(26)-N(2))-dimethyltransferase-like isoform X1 [Centruroides vittatus]|uniref:tRNA (guanine(26)-N(2))-dimethyltransferase-like isoform X1 n=1 Tax=Centruroides vittatus TaxID=120091 RepID=UPI00350F7A29